MTVKQLSQSQNLRADRGEALRHASGPWRWWHSVAATVAIPLLLAAVAAPGLLADVENLLVSGSPTPVTALRAAVALLAGVAFFAVRSYGWFTGLILFGTIVLQALRIGQGQATAEPLDAGLLLQLAILGAIPVNVILRPNQSDNEARVRELERHVRRLGGTP